MPKREPEVSTTSWQDILEVLPAWESEHDVTIVLLIRVLPTLATGAYVEAVVHDGRGLDVGKELLRVRMPFPARKGSGQAGAALHAIYCALNEHDRNPWLWSPDRRRRAVGEG